ncbi:hypothetical protein FRC11_000170, partial [Ceratobasidium sp. 423]
MSFVSEEYFIIPRHAKPDAPYTFRKLGSLEIYRLPLSYDQTRPYARFMLSDLDEAHNFVHMGISGNSPAPLTGTAERRPGTRIYELGSEDRQLCVHIHTTLHTAHGSGRGGLHGWLCVSTKVLVKFLREFSGSDPRLSSHNEPLEIPWSAWGSYASWISIFDTELPEIFILGQRGAFLRWVNLKTADDLDVPYLDFHVIDFDQNRNRDKAELPRSISTVYPADADRNLGSTALRARAEQTVFRGALFSSTRSCPKVVLNGAEEILKLKGLLGINGGGRPLLQLTDDDWYLTAPPGAADEIETHFSQLFDGVMIDDEH